MDIPSLNSVPDADAIRKQAKALGIERHLLDLHTYGVTIIPPELVAPQGDLIDRLREALLGVIARRHELDVPDDWRRHSDAWGGPKSWSYLFEDEAFIEAALNPVAQCVAQFMCGRNAVLQGTASIVKTRSPATDDGASNEQGYLGLHTDTHGVPSPLPEWAQFVNISWLLTDYLAKEDGPTVLVPGSHRFGRMPRKDESEWWLDNAPVKPVELQGRAGSLAIWHGSLWHGSRPRTVEGMRITALMLYGRSYMQPIHDWPATVAQGDNAKHLEKFPELKELLGLWHPYPTDAEGPGVPQKRDGNQRMMGVGDNIYA